MGKADKSPETVHLTEGTVERLRQAHQQINFAVAHRDEILSTALEAMGVTGKVAELDLDKGTITMEEPLKLVEKE